MKILKCKRNRKIHKWVIRFEINGETQEVVAKRLNKAVELMFKIKRNHVD